MKEHLDRVIKEQLGTYELPYDEGAWEAFSQKLGPAPTATTSTPFYRNWWFAASVVTAIVATATWLGLSTSSETPANTQLAVNTDEPSVSGTTATAPAQNTVTGSTHHSAKAHTSATQGNGGLPTNGNRTANDSPLDITPINHTPQTVFGTVSVPSKADPIVIAGSPAPNDNKQNPDNSSIVSAVALEMPKAVCMGEQIEISNPNKMEALVLLPDGTQKRIPAGKKAIIAVRNQGDIMTSCGDLTQRIEVNSPKDIAINENGATIEDGIPVVKFEISGNQGEVRWETNCNAKTTENNGRTLIVHPYTDKTVNAKAIVIDDKGCKSTAKASVDASKVINLGVGEAGAVTPNGVNTRFMPYMLIKRDTPFKLTIRDPKTSQVIYETSDAGEGWDGMNHVTNQLASGGVPYIWEVEMKNPLSNEPRIYSGVVLVNRD